MRPIATGAKRSLEIRKICSAPSIFPTTSFPRPCKPSRQRPSCEIAGPPPCLALVRGGSLIPRNHLFFVIGEQTRAPVKRGRIHHVRHERRGRGRMRKNKFEQISCRGRNEKKRRNTNAKQRSTAGHTPPEKKTPPKRGRRP